ncbi:MAG: sugar-binding protein [Armatimonadota bacterium]
MKKHLIPVIAVASFLLAVSAKAVVTINTTASDGTMSAWQFNGVTWISKNINIGGEARRLVLADPMNNGRNDAYVAAGNGLFRISASGATLSSQAFYTEKGTWSVASGDVDGNGKLDIVVGGDSPVFKYEFNSAWQKTDIIGDTYEAIKGVTAGNTHGGLGNEIGVFCSTSGAGTTIGAQYNGTGYSQIADWLGGNWTNAKGGVDLYGDGTKVSVATKQGKVAVLDFSGAAPVVRELIADDSGMNYYAVAIGDAKNDGKVSVVTGADGGSGWQFILNYERSEGTWNQSSVYSYSAGKVTGLSIADVDGDGFNEVVAVNDEGIIRVFRWNGTEFAAVSGTATSQHFTDVSVGDIGVDPNTPLESVALNTTSTDGRVTAWMIDGNGWTSQSINLVHDYTPGEARRLVLADPMNNGHKDAYVVASNGLFRVSADGGAINSQALYIEKGAWSVASGDVDGNGKLDIVVGGDSPVFKYEYNSGWQKTDIKADTYEALKGITTGNTYAGLNNEIGIFCSSSGAGTTIGMQYNGSGYNEMDGWLGGNWTHAKGGADLYGDGIKRSVVTKAGYVGVVDFIDGYPAVREWIAVDGGMNYYTCAIGDSKNDGKVSVIVGADGGSGWQFLQNYERSDSAWNQSSIYEYNAGKVTGLDIGDCDGDGLNEVVAVNDEGLVRVFKWNGTNFALVSSVQTSQHFTDVAIGNNGGSILTRPGAIDYSNSVTVDGNLSEWSNADWVPIDKTYDGNPTDVAEAYYAAKWGDSGTRLYVAVKVRDTAHHFTNTYDDWYTRDAAEIYIHTTGEGPIDYSATQAAAQEYAVGIMNSNPSQVWTAVGYNNSIPSAAGFQAAGRVDGDWIYYEVAATPFHFFSLDGNGLVVSPLQMGDIIGLDVVVCGNNGTYTGMKSENMATGKSRNYNSIGRHILVQQTPIYNAKTATEGSTVSTSALVTAAFDGYFYVESQDRTSGIRVQKSKHGVHVGESVTVFGKVETLPSGERCINASYVFSSAGETVAPLGVTNKSLGGGSFAQQQGVTGGYGLNNIGLLLRTTGSVTQTGAGRFTITDGSATAVSVAGNLPSGATYVAVTGALSCEKIGTDILPVILSTDIQKIQP